MPNIQQKIKKHNNKIVRNNRKEKESNKKKKEKNCNCQKKNNCPLENNCQQKSVVYGAKIITRNKVATYAGVTKNSFKVRYRGHVHSFKQKKTTKCNKTK